ncbi:MAG: hypothetical protein JWQ54_5867 [Mucilaginibacter sp.]|nr:hypothetical protein [Mucilaginibacter sp.]
MGWQIIISQGVSLRCHIRRFQGQEKWKIQRKGRHPSVQGIALRRVELIYYFPNTSFSLFSKSSPRRFFAIIFPLGSIRKFAGIDDT